MPVPYAILKRDEAGKPVLVLEMKRGGAFAHGGYLATVVVIDATAKTIRTRRLDPADGSVLDVVYTPGADVDHPSEEGLFWAEPAELLARAQ